MHVSKKSNQQLGVKNAISLCLNQYWTNYIKKIEKTVVEGYIDNKLEKDENVKLYDILLQKHTNKIFVKRPNAIGIKLQRGKKQFEKLDLLEQAEIIIQILQITQLNGLTADLRLIGDKKEVGAATIGKNISETEEFVLINQSSTGLYESEIDLKTI